MKKSSTMLLSLILILALFSLSVSAEQSVGDQYVVSANVYEPRNISTRYETIYDGFYGYYLQTSDEGETSAVITDYTGSESHVTIPDSFSGIVVREVSHAFEDNDFVTEVTVPQSVQTLNYAFRNCKSLQRVILNEGIEKVYDAFDGCEQLYDINFPQSLTYVTLDDLRGTKWLSQFDSKEIVYAGHICLGMKDDYLTSGYKPDDFTITIREGTTIIAAEAFDLTTITEVYMPDSVENIQADAFRNCLRLKKIHFSKNLKRIGSYAFSQRYDDFQYPLTEVVLPDSLEYLGDGAFNGNKNLASINEPKNIQYVGNAAFDDTKWAEILPYQCYFGKVLYKCKVFNSSCSDEIRKDTVSISPRCFADMGSVNIKEITSISIPDTVQTIGYSAFEGCQCLKEVKLPDQLKSIEEATFHNCHSLSVINLPDTIERIEENAFWNCYALEVAKLPDSLNYIGPYAFENCNSIYNIEIPRPVKRLGDGAFSACSLLETVTFHEGLEYIGEEAFFATLIADVDLPNSINYLGKRAFAYGAGEVLMDAPSDNKMPGFEIHGYDGSLAEIYAEENELIFENLGEYTPSLEDENYWGQEDLANDRGFPSNNSTARSRKTEIISGVAICGVIGLVVGCVIYFKKRG